MNAVDLANMLADASGLAGRTFLVSVGDEEGRAIAGSLDDAGRAARAIVRERLAERGIAELEHLEDPSGRVWVMLVDAADAEAVEIVADHVLQQAHRSLE